MNYPGIPGERNNPTTIFDDWIIRVEMKSRHNNFIIRITLTLIIAILSPCQIKASTTFPNLPKKEGCFIFKDATSSGWKQQLIAAWVFKDKTISDLKISRKSILDVWCSKDYTKMSIWANKPGTAVISFRLSSGKQTKKYSVTFYIREYKNPLKSITLRGVELISKYRRSNTYRLIPDIEKGKLRHPSGRFRVTPRKGWTVTKIRYKNDQDSGFGSTIKFVKNGKKIVFPYAETVHLTVYLKHRSTGIVYPDIWLTVDRSDGAD